MRISLFTLKMIENKIECCEEKHCHADLLKIVNEKMPDENLTNETPAAPKKSATENVVASETVSAAMATVPQKSFFQKVTEVIK